DRKGRSRVAGPADPGLAAAVRRVAGGSVLPAQQGRALAAYAPARFHAKEGVRSEAPPISDTPAGTARFGIHSRRTDELAPAAAEEMAVRPLCHGPGGLSSACATADAVQDAQNPALILRQREALAPEAAGVFREGAEPGGVGEGRPDPLC